MKPLSLFTKIFFWFWLATILVAVATILSIHILLNPEEEMARAVASTFEAKHAKIAVTALEESGQQGLLAYLDEPHRHGNVRSLLFDQDGHELAGLAVPPEWTEFIDRIHNSNEIELQRAGDYMLAAVPVVGPSGRRYTYVSELPRRIPRLSRNMTNRPRRGPPNPDERRPTSPDPMDPPDKGPPGPLSFLLGQPEMLPLILTTVIITGGALCYWLARYLTNPLQKLRNAAKELAQGDLSVRVGSSVGKRRDEIGDLGRDFDHMAGRMDSLVNAQRRLLRDISHELRSPLARVNVALGIARQHADPDRSAPLDRIEHETERLNDLIGQLLALARFESGTDGVHQDMVDLVQIIQNVTEDADFEAQSRHRQVRLIRSEPCATQGSSEMLHRAIENVIRNAVYYTAEHTTVEVALRRQNDRNEASAVITVRDHGQGVPQESLADIFRPFYRVAEARERQSGGMGLGLSITERAIRAHGGHIQASNAPGGGLLIEIQLPLIQT